MIEIVQAGAAVLLAGLLLAMTGRWERTLKRLARQPLRTRKRSCPRG
jgi:hypothetical protein